MSTSRVQVGSGLMMFGDDDDDPQDPNNTIVEGDEDEREREAASDAEDDVPYENPQTGERSRKREHSPPVDGTESTKKARYEGTAKHGSAIRAKHSKEADEHIYRLKKQGYTDQYVANYLNKQNVGTFVAKTISERHRRIRQKKEQEEDEKLDDELSDWHLDEDEKLQDSCTAIEKKFEIELQKLQDKKWKEISVRLADSLKKKKYTAKACKERFEGLLAGTALMPIELDPDKDGRAEMRVTRIAKAKAARAAAAAEVKRIEDEKERKAQEDADRKARIRQDRDENRLARAAAKAEDKRIREERQAGKIKERAAKLAAQERAKKEVEEKRQLTEAENAVYRYYMGKSIKRTDTKATKNANDDEEEEYDDFYDSDEEEESEMSDLDDTDEDDASSQTDEEVSCESVEEKLAPTIVRPVQSAQVTKGTLLNPRIIMTMDELDAILFERNIARRTNSETCPQVVARIAAADETLSSITLVDLLKNQFATVKGSRADKILRLQECDAQNSEAGKKGKKSTDLEFQNKYGEYIGQ